jgi:hypothetical protein
LLTIQERLLLAFKSSAPSTVNGADGEGGQDWGDDSQAPSSTYSQAFARLGKGLGAIEVLGSEFTVIGFQNHLVEPSWWFFRIADYELDFDYAPRSQSQTLKLQIGGAIDDSSGETEYLPGIELYSMHARNEEEHPRSALAMSVEKWREWCTARMEACMLTGTEVGPKAEILVSVRRTAILSTMDISGLKTARDDFNPNRIVKCIFSAEFPDMIRVTLNAQNLIALKSYVENLLQRTESSAPETPVTAGKKKIVYVLDDSTGIGSPFVFNPTLQPFVAEHGKITVEWILAQLGITDLERSILKSVYRLLHVPLSKYVNSLEASLHTHSVDTTDKVPELVPENSRSMPLKKVKATSLTSMEGRSGSWDSSPRVASIGSSRSPALQRRILSPRLSTAGHRTGRASRAGSSDRPSSRQTSLRPHSAASDGSGGYFTPPGSTGSFDRHLSASPLSSPLPSPLGILLPTTPVEKKGSSLRVEEHVHPSGSSRSLGGTDRKSNV